MTVRVGATPAGIVLAAGESSRLGQFKPLLPWPDGSDVPLVAYQVEQLVLAGVSPVVVVVGARANEVRDAVVVAGAMVVVNSDYQSGKASSVRLGVAAAPPDRPLLIIGVDQPRTACFLQRLVRTPLLLQEIRVPSHAGHRGHPPIFGTAYRAELAAVDEATAGLRSILRKHVDRIVHFETDDPQALVNINTSEELEAARQFARQNQRT